MNKIDARNEYTDTALDIKGVENLLFLSRGSTTSVDSVNKQPERKVDGRAERTDRTLMNEEVQGSESSRPPETSQRSTRGAGSARNQCENLSSERANRRGKMCSQSC